MRKLLIILLTAWLSLQGPLAAWAASCAHATGQGAHPAMSGGLSASVGIDHDHHQHAPVDAASQALSGLDAPAHDAVGVSLHDAGPHGALGDAGGCCHGMGGSALPASLAWTVSVYAREPVFPAPALPALSHTASGPYRPPRA